MTRSESIRERLARAIYESDKREWAWTWDALVEGGKNRPYPGYPHLVDDYYRQADAVLAALPVRSGVTDSMVEAGARALADWDGADWDRPEQEFDAHEVITKRAYRVGATAVLTTALGSRDADAPGDGSAS